MVVLYHGANQVFRRPVPSRGRMCTDFGRGFYLTPNFETAKRIALRSVDFSVVGRPVVLAFEFDSEKALRDLRTKTFARIDIPWTKFVIANRKRDVSADLCACVMKYEGVTMQSALHTVYVSRLYGRMQDPESQLYRESALYLYDMLCEERGIKSKV